MSTQWKIPFRQVRGLLIYRPLQHMAFWLLAYAILLQHFASSSQMSRIDAVYTAVFMIPLFFSCYLNLLIFIPQFFEKGRYAIYSIGLAVSVWAGVELHGFAFNYLVDRLFPGFYLISYYDRFETLRYLAIFVGITMLLHFSKSWWSLRESENQRLMLQKEKSDAELQGLKAQVNPHFLFNTLNSILSLVSPENNRARVAVLRLADSLRYIIYESNQPRVPIERELDYLANYLELQRLRCSAKDSILFRCEGEVENREIAPLLVLPLIENAFKHGIKAETGKTFVHIRIELSEKMIRICVENNRGRVDPDLAGNKGGFGLDNLRKRLELEYPDRHSLNLEQDENKFSADLKLW